MKKHFTYRYVKAADDFDAESDAISDTVDDISDTIDNLQDDIDSDYPDDTYIDINNNIADHYIAECDRCHEVFISPTIYSENNTLKSTEGECPVCHDETKQVLKWVIKSVEDADDPVEDIEFAPSDDVEIMEEEHKNEDKDGVKEESEERVYEF